jgi:hypothetical protein
MRERAIGGPALAAAVLLVTAAACSGGGDDQGDDDAAAGVPSGSTAPATTAAPEPCGESRHLVVLDISGTITATKDEVIEWLSNADDVPLPRELAPELAAAYQDRGYELLYVTGLPGTNKIGGVAVPDAMTKWLTDNGFPVDGARVETSHTPNPQAELSNDLIVLANEGVTLSAGYTDHPDDVQSFQVAGVEEIFLLGDTTAGSLSTSLPGGDLAGQLERVESLPQVCRP